MEHLHPSHHHHSHNLLIYNHHRSSKYLIRDHGTTPTIIHYPSLIIQLFRHIRSVNCKLIQSINQYRLIQTTVIRHVNLVLLLLLCIVSQPRYTAHCLRISLLDIPSPLVVGESAELTCNYDLEENALYSFKWYKDGIEFYRYVPRDYPQTQFLKIAGINVDVRKSSKKSVFLQNVNLSTRGKYRCEISAEAPSFVTAAKEGNLEVNVLPTMGPKISTDRRRYTIGDEIVSNCTSDKSNLEIHLNFTINGEPVSNSIDYGLAYSTQLHPDSLKTAGLSLHFVLTPKHFRHGKLKLKCIASLSIYNIKNEANMLITDHNYRPEPVFLSSESQARSEAKDIHTDQSNMNEWKIFSVLFSMYLHRQLQRVFSTN